MRHPAINLQIHDCIVDVEITLLNNNLPPINDRDLNEIGPANRINVGNFSNGCELTHLITSHINVGVADFGDSLPTIFICAFLLLLARILYLLRAVNNFYAAPQFPSTCFQYNADSLFGQWH